MMIIRSLPHVRVACLYGDLRGECPLWPDTPSLSNFILISRPHALVQAIDMTHLETLLLPTPHFFVGTGGPVPLWPGTPRPADIPCVERPSAP